MGEKESITSKATAMKKAGFHPVMILVITVLSSPGIWERFFNDTDKKAMAAVEKAYPLLAQEVEDHAEAVDRQREINQELVVELTRLKTLVEVSGMMPLPAPAGVYEDPLMGIGIGGGGGWGYGMGVGPTGMPAEGRFPASADGDADIEVEAAVEPSEDVEDVLPEPKPSKKGSKSLHDLVEQQEHAPARKKLPDLGELLGKDK